MSRLLTPEEVSAYFRFSDYMAVSEHGKFFDQLRRIEVIREDSEHTTFSELECAGISELPSNLMAFYDDADGGIVDMTFAFVKPGVIAWVDRHRVDGKPVQNTSPLASDLRFTIRKDD